MHVPPPPPLPACTRRILYMQNLNLHNSAWLRPFSMKPKRITNINTRRSQRGTLEGVSCPKNKQFKKQKNGTPQHPKRKIDSNNKKRNGWVGGRGFSIRDRGRGGVSIRDRQIGKIARLRSSPDWEVRQIGNIPTNGQIGD